MTRVVKRYGGERLYDAAALAHTTVAALRALQGRGVTVVVQDAATGRDVTQAVLG